MNLADRCSGKDNNFNLIRILAALAVLFTHSFALSGSVEPLRDSLGMTMGSFAVDIFFIASGFLVTGSLLKRQSLIEFCWARLLRIYPALLVALLLTVLVLGPLFTTLPLHQYFASKVVYIYLVKNLLLVAGTNFILPGVFENNPYPGAVNGSLWTMPYEVRMYLILAVSWLALRLKRQFRLRAMTWAILASTVIAGIATLAEYLASGAAGQFERLFFMFFCGASYYVCRDRIELKRPLFYAMVALLLGSAVWGKQPFFVVYTLSLAYLLFYLAYVPGGMLRRYNLVGDYSYGTYIYAFPVQQAVAALLPGCSAGTMILLSGAVTLALAALSWHLLEQRALALKGRATSSTHRLLWT
ncbi:acyltransferase family protein [Duganella sp. LjRoot269]|uniref:acyltransferase family protein n=1 Tax=Duganella sp. LjRoot269 TaxID=3342305 RepID=UPI003ECF211E